MRLLNFQHHILTGAFLAAVALTLPAHAGEARIVSVGGSTTEIVYALGAADRLVGVDTTSLYPSSADALPDVGYVRQLSAEGLLSLRPDLILAGSKPKSARSTSPALIGTAPVTRERMKARPSSPERPARIAGRLSAREA